MTTVLWRSAVEAPAHAANDLGGTGARMTGGRCNSVGTPMLYCSANIALATLETLSFIRTGSLPFKRYLVRIDVPDPVWDMPDTLSPLPAGWDAITVGTDEPEGRRPVGSQQPFTLAACAFRDRAG